MTDHAHSRIGRVRMKAGGADVRVLNGAPPESQFGNDLMRAARNCAVWWPEMAGYFLVVWNEDGAFTSGSRQNPDTYGIPKTLFPAWIQEVARREVIIRQDVRDVIDKEYIFRPPGR